MCFITTTALNCNKAFTWSKCASNFNPTVKLCYVTLIDEYLTDCSAVKMLYRASRSTNWSSSERRRMHIRLVSSVHHVEYRSKEMKMNAKLVHRRASTPRPIINNILDKPPVKRQNTLPSRLEVIPERDQKQEFLRCRNGRNVRPCTVFQNELIKLPWIDDGVKHKRKDSSTTETTLTTRMRRSSLCDSFCSETIPGVSLSDTLLPRQCLWGTVVERQGYSKALRQFIKNAEGTFDSNTEKTVILYNWINSQTLLNRS